MDVGVDPLLLLLKKRSAEAATTDSDAAGDVAMKLSCWATAAAAAGGAQGGPHILCFLEGPPLGRSSWIADAGGACCEDAGADGTVRST